MKIGFKNFKKFQEFPMIELAPITFLVGSNNSGKSSFIKALTFLFSNLRNQEDTSEVQPHFIKNVSFFQNSASNYDWGDFTTTLYRGGWNDDITFLWNRHGLMCEFSFGATPEEIRLNPSLKTTLPVKDFEVESEKHGIVITNVLNDNIWATKSRIAAGRFVEWLKSAIEWLKARIEHRNSASASMTFKDLESWDRTVNRRLGERIETQLANYEAALQFLEKDPSESWELQCSLRAETPLEAALHDYFVYCINSITRIASRKSLYSPAFEYIEAHNAPHTNAIAVNDKNSFLARTVAEFNSEVPNIPDNSNIYAWVNEWLHKFGIGDFFEIGTHFGGEILTVGVGKKSEEIEHAFGKLPLMPLASLGTGSIQLFVLLLKIATVLKRVKEGDEVMIIIEEPEQNLHPALQSKLADLFLQVNKNTDGKVQFVVETHSEYLIRRTQVMVARGYDNEDNDFVNPFKVYYFPEDGTPYDMKYLPSGRFENNFGEGFFDETAKWHLEIIRREKARK